MISPGRLHHAHNAFDDTRLILIAHLENDEFSAKNSRGASQKTNIAPDTSHCLPKYPVDTVDSLGSDLADQVT
jgi:hypothetical protein